MKLLTGVVALAALVFPGNGTHWNPLHSQDERQPVRTMATAIVVDAVVRDKQGRPVLDLGRSDFELYEDDVRQTIGDVTLVAPGRTAVERATRNGPVSTNASTEQPDSVAPAESRTSIETPTFVALVFDRLSPESRALVHKGALAYLERATPDDFAGVFLIDLHLETIHPYTNDRAKLRKAIDEVASRATTTFHREAHRVGFRASGDMHPTVSPTASAEEHGPPDPQTREHIKEELGKGSVDGTLVRTAERMERKYEAMIRDEQGFATTNGLLTITDALGLLPGRKTVVFFADGLAIPPAVQSRFDSVVATANRANVSIYTVDAAGLRVHSKAAETARQIDALGEVAIDERNRDEKMAWTKSLELNEDILKQDPSVSLGMLADRTGGFLINNTNDLETGFRRIDLDRRFHYLLTYTPANSDFGGEWRRISVKVPRRDVTVRARTGYVAVRAPGALPLLAHEGPALAALERVPLPGDIPVRGRALVFPQRSGPARVLLLVATSGRAVMFDTQSASGTYRTDFTVLARIRHANGEVVRKASQPYRLSGRAADVDAAKRGDVLFFRQPELGPGRYTLEYVVHDALAKRAGAASAPITIPDARSGPQLSSLIIVQRAERVTEKERDAANPLYYGDLLLYPNLGEPISRSAAKTLSFFFTVIPVASGPRATAVLELHGGGAFVGKVPLELAAPGGDGRIQHVSQLPLVNFAPGDYELRVEVSQGPHREVRTAAFRLID